VSLSIGVSSDPTLMKPSKETRRVEGRDQPKENPRGEAGGRTQCRETLPPNLARVNAAAQRADQTRFTALLHHINRAALERAFRGRSGRQVRESMG